MRLSPITSNHHLRLRNLQSPQFGESAIKNLPTEQLTRSHIEAVFGTYGKIAIEQTVKSVQEFYQDRPPYPVLQHVRNLIPEDDLLWVQFNMLTGLLVAPDNPSWGLKLMLDAQHAYQDFHAKTNGPLHAEILGQTGHIRLQLARREPDTALHHKREAIKAFEAAANTCKNMPNRYLIHNLFGEVSSPSTQYVSYVRLIIQTLEGIESLTRPEWEKLKHYKAIIDSPAELHPLKAVLSN